MSLVIIGGALANKPLNGGEAWVRLSWIEGFRRLGFDVCFIEQIDRAVCVDEQGNYGVPLSESLNLAYFRKTVERFGLSGQAALIESGTGECFGLDLRTIHGLAASADLLVNISGHLSDPLLKKARTRAYIDIDPGFTQFWQAAGTTAARLEGHDHYFTVGLNIGRPECEIPNCGIRWLPILPPVVLDDWPVTPCDDPGRFTTIASWRNAFGPITFGDKTFGLKVHEFRKFAELPGRVADAARFEIALDIHPGDSRDLAMLQQNNWRIVNPRDVATDPDTFRRYVQQSGGEFSVAQGIYVQTRSGWFSDRTVRYLASGKPVLVQETGFSRTLATGRGLFSFNTLDEAMNGARQIVSDYAAHCAAAREIAERFFDARNVLGDLLTVARIKP